MKFSAAFTALVVIVPLFSGQVLAAAANVNNVKGQGGNNKNAGNNNNNSTTGGGGDPQTSLTLDPKVIATGFANNGQQNATAGQVPSLTSTNNFINFCLTVPNLPITNGQQITTGSCNPAPMGVIPSTANMPSSKFQSPLNGDDVPPNTTFNIVMAINNLETGNFCNAQENYYSAPQQVNGQGQIIGHSHVVVQTLASFTDPAPIDPRTFAFFKGLNAAAKNGVITQAVDGGLPSGVYRLCSINTDMNHSPVNVPVAQHGSLDDCVYFSAGQGKGASPFNGSGGNSTNNGNVANNATNTGNNGGNVNNVGNNGTATNTGNNATATNTGKNGKNAGKNGANATPPANSAKPPAASAKPPAASAKPPANGAKPPANGAKPPANGAKPPANGAKPPANGAKPPANGAKPPANGANVKPLINGANGGKNVGNNVGKGSAFNKIGGRRMVARLARDH